MKNRALARRYGIALYQVAKEKKEEQCAKYLVPMAG